MDGESSPRLDLRRSMTDARQWLVEAEDNPLMTDAARVDALDALTVRRVDGRYWRWRFPDGSTIERLGEDDWRTGEAVQ